MAGRRRGRELLGEGRGSPRAGGRGQQAAGSPRAGRGEAAASSVQQEMLEDSEERRFCVMMQQLGATQVFQDQSEVRELWARLRRDRPELLSNFEALLSKVSTHIQEVNLEKDSMEQALRRRECDHDREVRSLYEEMEHQITIEKDRLLNQDSLRQSDKSLQLQSELRMRERELEGIVGRQKQLESQLHELSYEQVETRVQNERLRHTNKDLQDQLERSTRELETAQHHLRQLQEQASREQRQKDRDVVTVSRNMQKEKESLLKQLELLREMNKKLRDERDAHESRKLVSLRQRVMTPPLTPRPDSGHAHHYWHHPFNHGHY